MGHAGFYVGVDCGSQGTKAVVVDGENGKVVGSGYVGYGLIEGLPAGHREQNPSTWVEAMIKSVRDALHSAKIKGRVEGIGVSGQQHGFVPLDAKGEVIRPAKLWNDTSTAEECRWLIERLGGVREVVKLTGNTILPGFTAGKILWLRRHEPANYARLSTVLLPHDYLNYWLTGRVTMEPKPYEPRGNNIYRNTANGLLFARNVEALLKHRENVKLLKDGHAMVGLNPEVGHVLMGHEDLPGAFASVLREGRLAHSHWNSQPLGNYDQDLNAGVLGIDQMLATLLVFKMYAYSGFYGIDINPERMPVEKAIALNVNALNAGAEVVNGLDYDALVEAMYDPAGHRGAVEETLTKAWAPKGTSMKKIPR